MKESVKVSRIQALKAAFNRESLLAAMMIAAFALIIVTGLMSFRFVPVRPDTAPLAYMFGLGVFIFCLFGGMVLMNSLKQSQRANRNEQVLREVIDSYHRRTTQLQVAARIARDATAEPELEAVLSSAARAIHERFDFYHVGIFLLDGSRNVAILRATAGGPASQDMMARQHQVDISQGLVGRAISARQAMIVLDVSHDQYHLANPFLSETQSEMALPLIVRGTILGAIDVQSTRLAAFDQEDLTIMQTLADLLAVAIEKAQLYAAVQNHAEEMEQRVNQRTHELNLERAQLGAILNAMKEGVIYHEQNEPRYMNHAFTELTGYRMEDWPGFVTLLEASGISAEEVGPMFQGFYNHMMEHGYWQGELAMKRADGTESEALFTATRIIPERNSQIKGTVTILRDISQEKKLQEQKMRFVTYASHELRTPIANLKTRLYLLRRQPERSDVHVTVLEEVTERMQRLVHDLLLQSRFERGNIPLSMEESRLQDILLDVVSMQRPEAEKKQILLSAEMPSKRMMAMVDRDRIIQVMTNLISNAINYTHPNGRVWVRLRDNENGQAEITVSDTGVGIPDDMIDQVFQPFFRAQNVVAEGTGLGLNITKQIIDLHGGDIGVESRLGQGSSFTVWLKLLPAEQSQMLD